MQKSASVFARVEPEVKEQAEMILNQLGIPMSNAISLFLHQIIMQRGIPFDMKLPANKPKAIGSMSPVELGFELDAGYRDVTAGNLHDIEDVVADMQRDYGI